MSGENRIDTPPNWPDALLPRLPALLAAVGLAIVAGWLHRPLTLALLTVLLAWPWRREPGGRPLVALGVVVAVVEILRQLDALLVPVGLAVIFAYLVEPFVSRLQKRMSRTAASALSLLALLLAAGLLGLLVLPALLSDASSLLKALPRWAQASESWFSRQLPSWLERFGFEADAAVAWLRERAPQALKGALGAVGTGGQWIAGGLAGLAGSVLNLVLGPLFGFYLSAHAPALGAGVSGDLPQEWKPVLTRYAREIDRIFSGYLRGQLVVSLLVGALTSLGLWIAGMPYALLLGMATGLLNVIPLIGVWTMFAICALVGVFQPEPLWMLLRVAAVFAVVQGLESFLITPRVLGRSVGVHPALALLALFAFGGLLGLPGLILAVPLAAVVLYFGADLRRHWRRSRGLDPHADDPPEDGA